MYSFPYSGGREMPFLKSAIDNYTEACLRGGQRP